VNFRIPRGAAGIASRAAKLPARGMGMKAGTGGEWGAEDVARSELRESDGSLMDQLGT
jgi:hypothetical protein